MNAYRIHTRYLQLSMFRNQFLILSVAFAIALGCGQKNSKESTAPARFQQMQGTGIEFTNAIENNEDFNIFSYRNFYNGGGVAIGDINNDGLADVFFTANMQSNKLFLNKGNWQFDDVSDKAGIGNKGEWNTGVVMVDINGDGWLDIFVCNAGFQNRKAPECKLYINNKDLTFSDSAAAYGLTNKGGYTTHAAFFDYDVDGDLDCFIINNSFIPVNTLNYANQRELRAKDWPVADFLKGGGDKLLRNDNGRFTDVSQQAGIYGSLISFGLGVTVGDVNGDLYPDVYVSNDFFEKDYLYINQKNCTFKEQLEEWAQHISLSSMGADLADINNDGYPDLFVTDMLPDSDVRLKTTSAYENFDVFRLKQRQGFYNQFMQNTLQINTRNGRFVETGFYSGVAASDWSWGGLIFDADNDGLSDLYVCNGIYQDVTDQDFIDFFANDIIQQMVMTGKKEEIEDVIKRMPSKPIKNKAFRNRGQLRFDDAGDNWGFTEPSFSNGAAYGDLDNDGDLDLVTNNVNMPCFVYKNNTQEQDKPHYLKLKLQGTGLNTFAIGSLIYLYAGEEIITRELIPTRGFQSSCDYTVTVGLGNRRPDSLLVVWPNHRFTRLLHPATDTMLVLKQPETGPLYKPAVSTDLPLLSEVANNLQKHKEDPFIDFYVERNVPMLISHEGPRTAVGDVNGDGRADVFLCGAAGQAGQLYLQAADGSFVRKTNAQLDADAAYEDVTALLLDADGDGDNDLLTGTGGNHQIMDSPDMQNRLYLNDGKGNFAKASQALPHTQGNTSVTAANDWDGDGDIDLFVGERCVPRSYGLVPKQYLWQNDGKGHFTDVTEKLCPAMNHLGMVTGAAWANLNGDGNKQLVVVGEWMTPRIFAYNGKQFAEVNTNMTALSGWWQSLAAADMDGDGKDDLILGNMGENYYLKPTAEAPARLWVNDFDGNGIADKIFTRTVNSKDVPVFLKREITDQIPSLKKQNLRHHEFAEKSVQELVQPEKKPGTLTYTVTTGSSYVAYSNGGGKFDVQRLPYMTQLSCINAILPTDLNGDGLKDLVLGGNQFGLLPQFGRLDASYGHVIINGGKRTVAWVEPRQTGLNIRGQVRDIALLPAKAGPLLLFAINDSKPVTLRIQPKPTR